MSDDMMTQLAENLNDHQVTDDEGQIAETDTANETPALEEQTTETEPAQGDTPATPPEEHEDEEQVAEDDSGKKYVPKNRFDKVYGKMKELERKLQNPLPPVELPPLAPQSKQPSGKPVKVDKTDQLETELLFTTLPQFDPMPDAYGRPTNPEYNPVLDQMAFEIYSSRPGITKIAAGRLALQRAKQLSGQIEGVRSEARAVKSQQSDGGITTRVSSRGSSQVDPDKMSDQELESYLRSTGQW